MRKKIRPLTKLSEDRLITAFKEFRADRFNYSALQELIGVHCYASLLSWESRGLVCKYKNKDWRFTTTLLQDDFEDEPGPVIAKCDDIEDDGYPPEYSPGITAKGFRIRQQICQQTWRSLEAMDDALLLLTPGTQMTVTFTVPEVSKC